MVLSKSLKLCLTSSSAKWIIHIRSSKMIPEPVQRLADGVVQCMVILANCILFSLYHGVLRKRRVLKRKILNPTTKICLPYLALTSSLQYCPKLFLSSSLLACYSLFTKGKSLMFPAHLMPSSDYEFPRTVPVAQERLHYFPQQELFLSLKVQLLHSVSAHWLKGI